MNEQIYKLTDKGLTEFDRRLWKESESVCGSDMIDVGKVYNILLDVIEWDRDNVREIEVEGWADDDTLPNEDMMVKDGYIT